MTDQGRSARMSAYATASSHLALLSDLALERVVDEAPRVRPGIGGTSATLEVEGVRVFVKQVPVRSRRRITRRPTDSRRCSDSLEHTGYSSAGPNRAGTAPGQRQVHREPVRLARLLPVRPGIGGVRGLARAGRPHHDHQLGPERRAPGLCAALRPAPASRPGRDRGCLRGVQRPGRGGGALGGLGCRTRPPAGPAPLARTSGAVPRARPADPTPSRPSATPRPHRTGAWPHACSPATGQACS
jgi:hypothetical protein